MRRVVEGPSDLCVHHAEEIVELRLRLRDVELHGILASNELRELRRERDALRKELDSVAGSLATVETQHATLTSL